MMNPLRRRTMAAATLFSALSAFAATATAETWPARPITIVVAYPAGGDTDAIARTYAEKLSQRVGQPVLIDNRPGASGMIGNAWVAKAPADGYTLLFTPSTFPIAQHVLKAGPGVAHDVVRDFTPIMKTGDIPLLLVTAPSTGLQSATQLVAAAKAGRALTYGTPGAGSPMHIAGELFNRDAGIALVHAPYRGVAPVVNDALGGHVSVGWITPGAVASHIAAGKLLPLAVAQRQRAALLPTVPTLYELGWRDVDLNAWMGLFGPRAMPEAIVQALNAHFNEILRMPEVQARMATLGIEPVGGAPAVLARQIAQDDQRFGRLVREFGIRAD